MNKVNHYIIFSLYVVMISVNFIKFTGHVLFYKQSKRSEVFGISCIVGFS